MPILPQTPLNCDPAVGLESLRLVFVLLILCLWGRYARNFPFGWTQAEPPEQKKRAWRLKPRSPEACDSCQKGVKIEIFRPRTEVTPYGQTKSTRGRKKELSTAGYACPNQRCQYFGVMDETLHALVSDGKRGKNKDIQYWKCQACQKKFTSRL